MFDYRMANYLEFAILYLLVFYFPANILAVFNNDQNTPESFEIENTQFIEPKMFYYDKFGYLIVDGKVPGMSCPIVLDYKKYMNSCTSNIHYFFSFVVPDADTVEQVEFLAQNSSLMQSDVAEMLSTCPYGLTFCYEGQMEGSGTYRQFYVTNYISEDGNDTDLPSQKIAFQCMLTNNILNAHGFNMAVVAFPGLDPSKIKAAKDVKLDLSKYRCTYRFFVFTLSITREEYYFLVPDNGRIMLQIGDSKSFRSYFTDSAANELPPLEFEYGGEKYGTTTFGNVEESDPENGDFHDGNRGLWMLYLDFKRRYNELQVVTSVHSEDCDMHVEIRGTRMRKCRSYLQDIVVTEPSDVELDFMYTSEVGTIKKTEQGSEDLQEMLKKKEQERMRKTTTKTESKNKTESSKSETVSKGEKRVKETHKSSQTKLHASASATVSAQFQKQPVTRPSPNNGPRRPGNNPQRPNNPPRGNNGQSSNSNSRQSNSPGSGNNNGRQRSGNGNGNNNRRRDGGRGGDSRSRKAEQFLNGGKEFLGQAVENGLVNDAMKMINDGSALGKIKTAAMNEVNKGINTLQGLVKQGEMAATNLVNSAKAYGSYEESVQGGEEKQLEHVTKAPVTETKDITSIEKKVAAAAINTAAAIGCGLFSVFTAGFGSCSAKVEFKDIQTTTFNEAYTKSSINTQKQQKSFSSVHSVQQVLQTAFTHTKGSTESTTKSEQRSMSNAVTKRTVFLYEIEVPNDKILTPMQMAVNCDNSRVSIPWIKFRLTDIDEGFSDDYGEEEENFDIDEDEAPPSNANNKNEDNYPDLDEYDDLRRQSQQEKDADSAFNQEPTNNDNDDVYDEFEFDEEEKENKDEENKPTNTNTDQYSYYDAKRMLLKIFIFGCFMFLILEQIYAVFSGIEKGTQFTKEPKVVVHKHFYYDKFGNLVLNGSVPGNSSALTIDFKKYYPTCYTNVYFNFIFYFDPNAIGEICEEGMTICYEGQLFGEHVKPEYSESFKSTSGASELMEQSEFLQTTSAFTTRELVDIRISIPRNKKVIIKQLFFDCDGNIVKMPFILYTDGKERLKLQEQNASPKIKRPLSPNWANETSEDNLPKRKSMNVVSAPIEQNDDFDEFMNEYGA